MEALETLQSADLRLDTDSDDFAPCCDLAISACAKGSNWQGALEMLTKMKGCSMRTGDVTYSAAITACSNTEEWRVAMALCGELMMSLAQSPINFCFLWAEHLHQAIGCEVIRL